jgi:membrane-associated protease RseP (regulator of RpoE activity)
MSEEQVAPADGQKAAVFGIRITMVVPDTPAAKAGLQPGDLLLALNGKGWNDMNAIERFGLDIRKQRPGDRIRLRLRRGAEEKEAEVELARRPPEDELLQNGLLLGGFGIVRPDPELLSREQSRLQTAAEEAFFEDWLARRKQAIPPTPGAAGQD